MSGFSFTPGAVLPQLERGPITRGTLALYAGASSDHVMLHIDSDFAKAAGMGDVFAHGMLSMAYLAQCLGQVTPAENVLKWSVRFLAITPLHATVRCAGEVLDVFEEAGHTCARVRIWTTIDSGVKTLEGEALVALSA